MPQAVPKLRHLRPLGIPTSRQAALGISEASSPPWLPQPQFSGSGTDPVAKPSFLLWRGQLAHVATRHPGSAGCPCPAGRTPLSPLLGSHGHTHLQTGDRAEAGGAAGTRQPMEVSEGQGSSELYPEAGRGPCRVPAWVPRSCVCVRGASVGPRESVGAKG